MMVVLGDLDRVLWIDFDSAQTFPEEFMTEKQEQWIKEEEEMMEYFAGALVQYI